MAVHKPDLPRSGEHSLPSGHVTISPCRSCGILIGFADRCGRSRLAAATCASRSASRRATRSVRVPPRSTTARPA